MVSATAPRSFADRTSTPAGSDFVAASGTLAFGPGETSRTIAVSVNGDTTSEVNETFRVMLSNAAGATISRAQATGLIMNDDAVIDPIFANGFE